MMQSEVYAVYAAYDVYEPLELHKVFFSEQDAEVFAEQLRHEVDEELNEPEYEIIQIQKLKVH